MTDVFERLAPRWRSAVREYSLAVWIGEDTEKARETFDEKAALFSRQYKRALERYYASKRINVYRGTIEGKVAEWLKRQQAFRESLPSIVQQRQTLLVDREMERLRDNPNADAQKMLNRLYEAKEGENVYKVFSFKNHFQDRAEQIGEENAYELGTAINEGVLRQNTDRYIWRTQRDKRVRETHRKLANKCFLFDDPPTTVSKYGKEHTGNPGTEWGCVPSGTKIRLNSDVIRCFRREYAGELALLVTESGISVRATGNHPILTKSGWKPAYLVQVGDYVVKVPDKSVDTLDGDVYDTGVPVEQVFDFFSLCGNKESVPGARPQFHGDGIPEKEVDIVTVVGKLTNKRNSLTREKLRKLVFSKSDMMSEHLLRTSEGEFSAAFFWLGLSPLRIVRGLGNCLSLFGSGVLKADDVGLTSISDFNTRFLDNSLYKSAHRIIAKILPRASKSAHAADIVMDDLVFERVVSVMRVPYIGHVYNLQTATNWYIANGLSIHNCRCFADMADPKTKPLRGYVVYER